MGGVLPALFLKALPKMQGINQTVFLMFFGMMTYLACEALGLSGILGLLVCSILISHYAFYNLSGEGQQSATVFFSTLSFLAEAFVFIYLGLCSLLKDSDWSLSLTGYSLLAVLLSRLLAISVTSLLFRALYRLTGGDYLLDVYDLLVIYFSGSIRGAIAYGLVLSVTSTHASVIKSSCLLMVLVTTILFGASMGGIIKGLLYLQHRNLRPGVLSPESDTKSDFFLPSNENREVGQVYRWWRRVDSKFIKRLLVKDFDTRQEEFKLIKDTYSNIQVHECPSQVDIKYSSLKYGQVCDIYQ